jgi:hypothetical protein
MSRSASLNGTNGLPGWSGRCHGVHTLMNVGVLPASSFWIESRIRSANGRVSPQSGSVVSNSLNVKPKFACPSGNGTSRVREDARATGVSSATTTKISSGSINLRICILLKPQQSRHQTRPLHALGDDCRRSTFQPSV